MTELDDIDFNEFEILKKKKENTIKLKAKYNKKDGFYVTVEGTNYPIDRDNKEFRGIIYPIKDNFKITIYSDMRSTVLTRIHYSGFKPGNDITGTIVDKAKPYYECNKCNTNYITEIFEDNICPICNHEGLKKIEENIESKVFKIINN